MEKPQNAALRDEEAVEDVPVTTRLLGDDDADGAFAVTVDVFSEKDGNMDGTLSVESVDSHDAPVDVVGGDGEFVVVPKSGLPITSEKEPEPQEADVEKNFEIPSITKQLSVNGRGSLAGVEYSLRQLSVNSRKASALPAAKHGLQGLSDMQKHTLGIILIILHCLSIAGASQFAKKTYSRDFSAPCFLVYFRSCWRICVFPTFMVLKYIHRVVRHRHDVNAGPVSFMKTYTSCTSVFGPEGLTVKSFFYPCGVLSIWWVTVQFMHVFAVKFLNNSIVAALFCSETAFCYLLSAIILKVPVYALKVTAVIVALAGVSLMAYSQAGNGTDLRWEGLVICLTGAFLGSGYMVSVKKTLGKTEDVGQALLLTSAMSLFVTLTCWPIVIGLYYWGVEYWNVETFPWTFICTSSGLTLISISIFNLCLTLTSPLMITLSKLLGIPVNYLIDWLLYNHQFDVYQIIGVMLIGFGFVFIALPERWLGIKRLSRKIRRQRSSVPPPTIVVNGDAAKSHI